MFPSVLKNSLSLRGDIKVYVATALSLILLLALALSFREIYSVDIGLHLAPGRWIIFHKAFPQKDPFTYTVPNNDYIDVYWLYQVFLAFVDKVGGSFLLVLVNGLLVTFSVYLVFYRSHHLHAPPLWLSFVMLFAVTLTMNYEIRPHVVSWLYLNFLFLVFDRHYHDTSRSLIPVLIIMLLWVNTQPTFILGWLVIVSYWMGICLREKTLRPKASLYSALAILVCFVNPYTYRGVLLPFTQFGFLQESSLYKTLIAEYAPLPFFPLYDDFHFFGKVDLLKPLFLLQMFRILLLLLLVIQIARRKFRIHEVALCGLFFYVNSLAQKNVGYFIIAVTPLLLKSFGATYQGEERLKLKEAKHLRRNHFVSRGGALLASSAFLKVFCVGLSALCVTFIARAATNDYYSAQRVNHRFGYQSSNLALPVRATEFLRKHQLDGKIFNHLNFGGYLMDHLPQKIFIDARNEVIGEKFGSEYMKTTSNEQIGEVVSKYKPDIALFPHKEGLSWLNYFMRDTTHWRLVYFDELAGIYLTKGYAEGVPRVDPESYPPLASRITNEEMDTLLKKKFDRSLLDPFTRQQYYPVKESEISVFCFYNDWQSAAIRIAMEGIKKSTVDCPELFVNLGLYFYSVQDFKRAKICLERFLGDGYHYPGAEETLRSIMNQGRRDS